MIRAHRRFRRKKMRSARLPSYLLPSLARAVVFEPSLRRAGRLLAEMSGETDR